MSLVRNINLHDLCVLTPPLLSSSPCSRIDVSCADSISPTTGTFSTHLPHCSKYSFLPVSAPIAATTARTTTCTPLPYRLRAASCPRQSLATTLWAAKFPHSSPRRWAPLSKATQQRTTIQYLHRHRLLPPHGPYSLMRKIRRQIIHTAAAASVARTLLMPYWTPI